MNESKDTLIAQLKSQVFSLEKMNERYIEEVRRLRGLCKESGVVPETVDSFFRAKKLEAEIEELNQEDPRSRNKLRDAAKAHSTEKLLMRCELNKYANRISDLEAEIVAMMKANSENYTKTAEEMLNKKGHERIKELEAEVEKLRLVYKTYKESSEELETKLKEVESKLSMVESDKECLFDTGNYKVDQIKTQLKKVVEVLTKANTFFYGEDGQTWRGEANMKDVVQIAAMLNRLRRDLLFGSEQ